MRSFLCSDKLWFLYDRRVFYRVVLHPRNSGSLSDLAADPARRALQPVSNPRLLNSNFSRCVGEKHNIFNIKSSVKPLSLFLFYLASLFCYFCSRGWLSAAGPCLLGAAGRWPRDFWSLTGYVLLSVSCLNPCWAT